MAATARGCAHNGVFIPLRARTSVFCTHKHHRCGAQRRQFEHRQRHECPCACIGIPAAERGQCANAPQSPPVFLARCFQMLGVQTQPFPAAAQQMSGLLACLAMLCSACRHSPITRGLLKCNQAAKETSSSVLPFTKLRG